MNDFFRPTRAWTPPSFDPPPPPPPPPPTLTQAEIDATLARAREEGREAGYAEGRAKGEREGYESGLLQGREEGHREAFVAASERLAALTGSLERVLEAISAFPAEMGEPLLDLALEIGTRLSGNQSLDRAVFVAAVNEALARLPLPGETLHVRIGSADAETWKESIGRFELPFGIVFVTDDDVPAGHAFVELGGARADIGAAARAAIVRAALGLPLSG